MAEFFFFLAIEGYVLRDLNASVKALLRITLVNKKRLYMYRLLDYVQVLIEFKNVFLCCSLVKTRKLAIWTKHS